MIIAFNCHIFSLFLMRPSVVYAALCVVLFRLSPAQLCITIV